MRGRVLSWIGRVRVLSWIGRVLSWIGRVLPWALALAASVWVGLVLAPEEDWARYYFSSMLQGYGTLLGIVITVSIFSFQIVNERYGYMVARLRKDSRVLWCSAAYGSVILLSGLVLAVNPAHIGWLCAPVGGVVLFAGFLAFALTLSLAGNFAELMSPGTVVRTYMASDWGPEMVDGLGRAFTSFNDQGSSYWKAGGEAFVHALRDCVDHSEPRQHGYEVIHELCSMLIPRLFRDIPTRQDEMLAGLYGLFNDLCVTDPAAANEVLEAMLSEAGDKTRKTLSVALFDGLSHAPEAVGSELAEANALAVTRCIAFLWTFGRVGLLEQVIEDLKQLLPQDTRLESALAAGEASGKPEWSRLRDAIVASTRLPQESEDQVGERVDQIYDAYKRAADPGTQWRQERRRVGRRQEDREDHP